MCSPRAAGRDGCAGPETRAPLMPWVYLQTRCDILFLSAQRESSSGGCGFAQPAGPKHSFTFPSSRGLFHPFFDLSLSLLLLFFFFERDLLLSAGGVNAFIPLCPRSGAGGSCLGRWVISKVEQHLGFAPSRCLPPSLH